MKPLMSAPRAGRHWLPRLAALAMLLPLAGCSLFGSTPATGPLRTTPTAAPPTAATGLAQRPLHLPTLAAGAPCDTTKGKQVDPQYGFALGAGPVYPVGLGTDGVLQYVLSNNFGGGDWGGAKVLWIVSPGYHGPVLIRGGRLDGAGDVRFMLDAVANANPPAMLTFDAHGNNTSGWSERPSYTIVRSPGCYAYQVDGDSFSEVIIFQAVHAS